MCEEKGISSPFNDSRLNTKMNDFEGHIRASSRPEMLNFFDPEDIFKMHAEACTEEMLSE